MFDTLVEVFSESNPNVRAAIGLIKAMGGNNTKNQGAKNGGLVTGMFARYYMTLIQDLDNETWQTMDMERALLHIAPNVFAVPVGSATVASVFGRLHMALVTKFGSKEEASAFLTNIT
jgi:hypothetical protein